MSFCTNYKYVIFLTGIASGVRRYSDEMDPDTISKSSSSESFRHYLHDARMRVREKHQVSQGWVYAYDGLDPPPESLFDSNWKRTKELKDEEGKTNCDNSVNNPPSSSSSMLSNSPSNLLTSEEDKEFWNLLKSADMTSVSEVKLNRVIQKMMEDEISDDDEGIKDELDFMKRTTGLQEDVDFTMTSLGCFLDLLLERIELMSSNSLTTNLLATSILSDLAAFPQAILRSVLLQPDIVFQVITLSL